MQEHPPEKWLRDFVVDRLAATEVASAIHDGPLLRSKCCEGTAFVDGVALSALKFARVVAVFSATFAGGIGGFLKFHGNIFSSRYSNTTAVFTQWVKQPKRRVVGGHYVLSRLTR